LGFPTYRSYLESRIDYTFPDHGHLFKINVDENMERSVFDYYLANGRVMPYNGLHPLPQVGTTPDTYRELIENSLDYDESIHRDLWEFADDPLTVDTAMNEGQLQDYVNSGGMERPDAYYLYKLTIHDSFQHEALLGIFFTTPFTYRSYLQGRTDYNYATHGDLHNINVDERMPESVFDVYILNGVMPSDYDGPGPQVGFFPQTYREYVSNLADFNHDSWDHRMTWYHDPSDITDPYWTAALDPKSIENMYSRTDPLYTALAQSTDYSDGFAEYSQYVVSRTNYNTTLANMYSEAQFDAHGMSTWDHTYFMYTRNRDDYSSTVSDMFNRTDYSSMVTTGVTYKDYREERSDYDSTFHVWDTNDNLVPAWWQTAELQAKTKSDWEPTLQAFRINTLPAWRLVRYLPSDATIWHPVDDNLAGTAAAYGSRGDGTAKFNFIFNGVDDEEPFTEILISTRTFTDWVYFDKSVLDTIGSDVGYTCKRTVHNPYQSSTVNWFNRYNTVTFDPIIRSKTPNDRFLYVENSYDALFVNFEGSMVFVR